MDPPHFPHNSVEKGTPKRDGIMSYDAFDQNSLTEKLSKLNSSQQSVESTSKWCIFHRKRARQVVETWEKLFKPAAREQRIALLYLANDILQNSRRKGSEFVNEFWKVLPASLKAVYDLGDENCRKIAARLVDIWEDRKVFGSRGQNLKNVIHGNNPLPGKVPPAANNPSPVVIERKSNPIKVQKRDASFLRLKMVVGGLPEKILTSFQVLHDEGYNEEVAINTCRNVIGYVQEIEKDVVMASSQGSVIDSDVLEDLEKQENLLQQSISQLENSKAVRDVMVSQLREALEDQESKLELIRSELLIARSQVDQTANLKHQLASSNFSALPIMNQQPAEPTFPSALTTNNQTQTPQSHPLTSFMNSITQEDNKKATVAAVAAKLTASASSAQMLTSVLSSLVAEEAASKGRDMKRPKLENTMSFSNVNSSEGGSSTTYFPTAQQSMANLSQVNQLQPPYLPPPPPPPHAPPSSSPVHQLVQSNMTGGAPYGYGPPPSNGSMGFPRPGLPPQNPQQQQLQNPQQQQQQQLQNPQQQQQQQQPTNGGYYRPVGIGFYGQNHQPSTPPIHRQ